MYALDDRRVLRRYRERDVPEQEILVMAHARSHGFPVPAVYDVSGRDVVMQRVVGPTMREIVDADLSQLDRQTRTLAALHDRLHTIGAPPNLPAVGPGGTLVHLDLHAENVLVSDDGPYVIDWANARSGHWADDVAQTIAIMWSVRADERLIGIVDHFVEVFVAAFDRDTVRAHLPAALARRTADPNVSAAERDALRGMSL